MIGRLLFICCLFLTSMTVYAQRGNFGIFSGINIYFTTLKCDVPLNDDIKAKPLLSIFNLGTFYKASLNEKFAVLGSLEYLETKNRMEPGFTLRDIQGIDMGHAENRTINHQAVIGLTGRYKILRSFYVGTGIAGSFLIHTECVTDQKLYDSEGNDIGRHFNGRYYRKFTLSAPMVCGYEFGRFDIFMRFNKGLMSKLKGDGYVHEIDNILYLGFGYHFIDNQ